MLKAGGFVVHNVPDRIINLVVNLQFDYSKKAQTYLRTSKFSNDDLVAVVCSGYVRKKERDEKKKERYKYTIAGSACDGTPMYLVGKVAFGRFFVITFHERE